MNHKRISRLSALFIAAALGSTHTLADEPTPGALVQIYDIQENMEKIYPLSAGQLPNVARVVPTIDLRGERGDFAPYTKKFMTVVTADLQIKEAGAYGFRLSSDDGSILYIDGEKVIDHDGLHGADPAKETTRNLVAGNYGLRIEHFEYGGGEQVTLEWKPLGANALTLIPTTSLSIASDADRSTEPGKKEILRAPARPKPGDGMPLTGLHPGFELLSTDGKAINPVVTIAQPDGFPAAWPPDITQNPASWRDYCPSIEILEGDYTGDRLFPGGGIKGIHREFAQAGAVRFTRGLPKPVERVQWEGGGIVLFSDVAQMEPWGRLRPIDRVPFEIRRARPFSNGLEIEFTKPFAHHCGAAPEYYYILRRSFEDGGPSGASELVRVQRVSVSSDRKRAFVEFPSRAGYLYVRVLGDFTAESGERLWSTELWFDPTGGSHPTFDAFNPPLRPAPQNVLTDAERAAGWRLLFDGKTTKGWRSFRKSTFPEKGWAIEDGCLTVTGDGGGDIITEEQFDSFELSLEWKVSPSGNSGIFWHVTEDGRWVFETGPEMQVLDNGRHPDGRSMFTSAGSNYALHAPPEDNTKPVGLFNEARILVDGNHVEYHLNGHKQCAFDLGSDAFKKLVAESKFKDMSMFAKKPKGHIALQDHGDKVWYRNIKIRPIRSNRKQGGHTGAR